MTNEEIDDLVSKQYDQATSRPLRMGDTATVQARSLDINRGLEDAFSYFDMNGESIR